MVQRLDAPVPRTFIGSGALDARAAYPFESVYTSEKGLLMQAARDEVLAILRAEQLAEMFAWNEGEDMYDYTRAQIQSFFAKA